MKYKYKYVIVSTLFIAACNNPAADKPKATTTSPATVAQPPEKATPSPSAGERKVRLSLNPSNTTAAFVGSKITGSHDGKFEKLTGSVSASGEDPTGAEVSVSIDMSSVKTDSEKLDGHLKSADFFDVEKFPFAEFKSTAITAVGEDKTAFNVTGNLTLHGITKQIVFPAKIVLSAGKVEMESEFSINRKDFGIIYPGMPDDLIRDEVVIKLKLDATF